MSGTGKVFASFRASHLYAGTCQHLAYVDFYVPLCGVGFVPKPTFFGDIETTVEFFFLFPSPHDYIGIYSLADREVMSAA